MQGSRGNEEKAGRRKKSGENFLTLNYFASSVPLKIGGHGGFAVLRCWIFFLCCVAVKKIPACDVAVISSLTVCDVCILKSSNGVRRNEIICRIPVYIIFGQNAFLETFL